MLYLKSSEGEVSIIVLDSANLEEIKRGRPAKTPDGKILIAWTPDPVWLADKIIDTKGDAVEIGKLIDEASKRPQKPSNRPKHDTHFHQFGG